MNERFINIKVDREERPDVDAIYQNVAQIFTQGGGWPLTVFLLPDGRAAYGGTYFPPEDKFGRPGFPKVLLMLSEMWENDREKITGNAVRVNEIMGKLIHDEAAASGNVMPVKDYLLRSYDDVNGGFGGAPKFPNTMGLTYLWREGQREPVIHSLLKMINGGIFDQLGGGFHRYSVDAQWSVPHFEKMLYDQSLILKLIAEVLCTNELESVLTVDQEFRLKQSLTLSLEYLEREMKHPLGFYYSAQDADTPMGEGYNFVWDQQQVRECFSDKKDAELFISVYRVREGGNFEHGKTVLSRVENLDELALGFSVSKTKLESILERVRKMGFESRESRVKPVTDEKILTGINGLMLSALAWSYGATRDPKVQSDAITLAKGIRDKLWNQKTQRLYSLGYGENVTPKGLGFFSDYAFLARGLVDLCRILPSDSEESLQFFNWARELTEIASELFRDDAGEWSETSSEHEQLLFRPKATSDQAVPSGVSVWIGTAFITNAVTSFSLDKEFEKLSGLAAYHPFGSAEFACVAQDQKLGIMSISRPGEYLGFMHPRAIVKPDTGLKVSQYCVDQTCYPFEGIESVRKRLVQGLSTQLGV